MLKKRPLEYLFLYNSHEPRRPLIGKLVSQGEIELRLNQDIVNAELGCLLC